MSERTRIGSPCTPIFKVPETPQPLLLSYRQTAGLLNVSERTVWSLVKRGELPAVRIGQSVRISREAVSRFIHQREERSGC